MKLQPGLIQDDIGLQGVINYFSFMKGRRKDMSEDLLDYAVSAALKAGNAIMKIYNADSYSMENKPDDSPVTDADIAADEIIKDILSRSGIPVLSEEGKTIPWEQRSKWERCWIVDPLDGTREFINQSGEFTVNIALVEEGRPVTGVVYAPVNDVLFTGNGVQGARRFEKASESLPEDDGWLERGQQMPCFDEPGYGLVASRSHPDERTASFIKEFSSKFPGTRIVSKGSALKLCMIASGEADIYPRYTNISEWDTAAGHAIILSAGGSVVQMNYPDRELVYNKKSNVNPWFIAVKNRVLLTLLDGML